MWCSLGYKGKDLFLNLVLLVWFCIEFYLIYVFIKLVGIKIFIKILNVVMWINVSLVFGLVLKFISKYVGFFCIR